MRLFLQLLTGTQVAGRRNNNFCLSGVYVLLFVTLCVLISLTIFSRKCRGIRPRRTSAIDKTIWPSVQKAFKFLPAFCFQKFSSDLLSKKLSKIFQRFAFIFFPAICFQKFSSDLLSKFCQLLSFQKFSSDLLSKSFQNFSSD